MQNKLKILPALTFITGVFQQMCAHKMIEGFNILAEVPPTVKESSKLHRWRNGLIKVKHNFEAFIFCKFRHFLAAAYGREDCVLCLSYLVLNTVRLCRSLDASIGSVNSDENKSQRATKQVIVKLTGYYSLFSQGATAESMLGYGSLHCLQGITQFPLKVFPDNTRGSRINHPCKHYCICCQLY